MILLLGTVFGCATPHQVRDVLGRPLAQPTGARIAVAAPRFLADALDVAGEGAEHDLNVFRANAWVGRIWMSRGYEILPEENNQIRSLDVELAGQDELRAQVVDWLDDTVGEALTASGLVVTGTVDGVAASPPVRRPIRGTTEFDGDDNINLPRYDLEPGPAMPPGVTVDADAIFVPVVVSYYSHNAGWFVGQEDGCWGGARMRVFWSLVAREDGTVLAWGDVGTTTTTFRLASPNLQQQQDLLLTVETEAKERLTRQLAAR